MCFHKCFVEIHSYDQELVAQGQAKGEAKGRVEGRAEERTENIEKTIEIMQELGADEDVIVQKLQEKYQISNEEIDKYLNH